MGALFSMDDQRPQLRVKIKNIQGLSRKDNGDPELDAYVQVTYGKLFKMTERGVRGIDAALMDNDGNASTGIESAFSNASNAAADVLGRITSISEDKASEIDNNDIPAMTHDSDNKDNENSNERNNIMGRESLSKGKQGTETQQSKTLVTKNQSRYFNETFYFPVPTITARYSLEISVWDKEFGPQSTDEYIGKAIIYYASKKEEMLDNNESKNVKYFLPTNWDESKTMEIEITDQNDSFVTGILEIEVEFQRFKYENYDGHSDNEEDNALIGTYDNSRKQKRKRKRRNHNGIAHNAPQSNCCSW